MQVTRALCCREETFWARSSDQSFDGQVRFFVDMRVDFVIAVEATQINTSVQISMHEEMVAIETEREKRLRSSLVYLRWTNVLLLLC